MSATLFISCDVWHYSRQGERIAVQRAYEVIKLQFPIENALYVSDSIYTLHWQPIDIIDPLTNETITHTIAPNNRHEGKRKKSWQLWRIFHKVNGKREDAKYIVRFSRPYNRGNDKYEKYEKIFRCDVVPIRTSSDSLTELRPAHYLFKFDTNLYRSKDHLYQMTRF